MCTFAGVLNYSGMVGDGGIRQRLTICKRRMFIWFHLPTCWNYMRLPLHTTQRQRRRTVWWWPVQCIQQRHSDKTCWRIIPSSDHSYRCLMKLSACGMIDEICKYIDRSVANITSMNGFTCGEVAEGCVSATSWKKGWLLSSRLLSRRLWQSRNL